MMHIMTAENGPVEGYWRSRPRAPAPGTIIGPVDGIENNGAKEFVFGKGRSAFSMFIVRRDPDLFGYLNICPHASLPLNYREGEFLNQEGDRIVCTMHFAEFRIEDGFGTAGAAENCWLDRVPVIARNGVMYIGGEAPVEEQDDAGEKS